MPDPVIPAWLRDHWWIVERMGAFPEGNLKGEFTVSFRDGRPTHTKSDVVGMPPPDQPRTRVLPKFACPSCGGLVLRERDYDNMMDCKGCGKASPRRDCETAAGHVAIMAKNG